MKKIIWVVESKLDSNTEAFYIHCLSRKEAREIKNDEKRSDYKARILKYELVGEVR